MYLTGVHLMPQVKDDSKGNHTRAFEHFTEDLHDPLYVYEMTHLRLVATPGSIAHSSTPRNPQSTGSSEFLGLGRLTWRVSECGLCSAYHDATARCLCNWFR